MVVFAIIFLVEKYVAKWSYKTLYLLLLSMFLIFVWTCLVSFSFICKFTFILLLSFWILCVAHTWVNVYVELLACKVDVQHPLPSCSHCFGGSLTLNLKLTSLSRLADQCEPLKSPCILPRFWSYSCCVMSGFSTGSGDLNSDPYISKTSSLSIEPSSKTVSWLSN